MRETAASKAAVPKPADLDAAMARIRPHVHHTPVLHCRSIDEHVGARLAFTCGNFQKVGASKFRGRPTQCCRSPTRMLPKNQERLPWIHFPTGRTGDLSICYLDESCYCYRVSFAINSTPDIIAPIAGS